jgi:choloylglycine hydrolase
MDFGINIGFEERIGLVGTFNITDVVLDQDKIPEKDLVKWKNKYGYIGRSVFASDVIVDGMNTEGLTVGGLYLTESSFPVYDPEDNRAVLAAYNIPNYILGMAKNVEEAVTLLESYQIVRSAIKVKPGVYVSEIPVHIIIRDAFGNSAVIEFINGETKVYKNAGNVLTNSPTYDFHIENSKNYESLLTDTEKNDFEDRVINYSASFNSTHPEKAALIGMPGDFSGASRFIKGYVLTEKMPEPHSSSEAVFQANSILDSLIAPPYMSSFTIWKTVKDLDNKKLYYKNLAKHTPDKKGGVIPFDINTPYTEYDLNSMSFSTTHASLKQTEINITLQDPALKIIPMHQITGGSVE